MGRPFFDGSYVAVEGWTKMIDGGDEVSVPGCPLQLETSGGISATGTRRRHLANCT
jgi:hypothetical protein